MINISQIKIGQLFMREGCLCVRIDDDYGDNPYDKVLPQYFNITENDSVYIFENEDVEPLEMLKDRLITP